MSTITFSVSTLYLEIAKASDWVLISIILILLLKINQIEQNNLICWNKKFQTHQCSEIVYTHFPEAFFPHLWKLHRISPSVLLPFYGISQPIFPFQYWEITWCVGSPEIQGYFHRETAQMWLNLNTCTLLVPNVRISWEFRSDDKLGTWQSW